MRSKARGPMSYDFRGM